VSNDSPVSIAAGCGLDNRNWDSFLRMGRLASIQDWLLVPQPSTWLVLNHIWLEQSDHMWW